MAGASHAAAWSRRARAAWRPRAWLLLGLAPAALLRRQAGSPALCGLPGPRAAPCRGAAAAAAPRGARSGTRRRGRATARAAAAGGTPSAQDLSVALGRELWIVADELLNVGAKTVTGRSGYAASLASAGNSLRNAADCMCSGDWESVMGELEEAVAGGQDVLPQQYMDGLINLYCYSEPLPNWEWSAASYSCANLGDYILAKAPDMLIGVEGLDREEALESIGVASERFKAASRLFQPGGFRLGPDPRTPASRAGVGGRRTPDGDPFGSAWREEDSEADEQARQSRAKEEEYRRTAEMEANVVGARARELLEKVESELAEAQQESERRIVLRRLVRELHPDVNQDRQEEVMPAFTFVQGLRELAADS